MNELLSVAPLAISAVAIIISFFQWWGGRGQRDATEASTLTGTALELVKALRTDLDKQEVELASLRSSYSQLNAELTEYQRGVTILIDQILDYPPAGPPRWMPPKKDV